MFKKGQSGNPNGRPRKELSIAEILRRIGKELVEAKDVDGEPILNEDGTPKMITKNEQVMQMVYDQAMRGDKDARNFIANRTEGVVRHLAPDDTQNYEKAEFLE